MVFKEEGVIYIPETGSTNHYLQCLVQEQQLTDETVVWTDFQTSGRGQTGNSWESEAGKNLTCSILFYPNQLPANLPFIIAEMAAVCVKRVLDKFVQDITVKWPNDVYWNDLKICGILVENQLGSGLIHHSVIGMGLNVNQETFMSNAPNPVSLKQITGHTYDRLEILSFLRRTFHKVKEIFEKEGSAVIHSEYMHALYRRNGWHLFRDKNGTFEAAIQYVELTGHLVLKRRNGKVSTYAFKEVEFLYPC